MPVNYNKDKQYELFGLSLAYLIATVYFSVLKELEICL